MPDIDAYAAEVSTRALALKCRGGRTTPPVLSTFKYLFDEDNHSPADGKANFRLQSRFGSTYPSLNEAMRLSTTLRDPGIDPSAYSGFTLQARNLDKDMVELSSIRANDSIGFHLENGGGWQFIVRANALKPASNLQSTVRLVSVYPATPNAPVHTPPPADWTATPATDVIVLQLPTITSTTFDFYARIEGGSGTLNIDRTTGAESLANVVDMVCRYDRRLIVGDYVEVLSDESSYYRIEGIEIVGREKWMRLNVQQSRRI